MARIRRYPFGGYFLKETLNFISFQPAVLDDFLSLRFSVLKTYFGSLSQFTLSIIYSFAIEFVLLIKYSF